MDENERGPEGFENRDYPIARPGGELVHLCPGHGGDGKKFTQRIGKRRRRNKFFRTSDEIKFSETHRENKTFHAYPWVYINLFPENHRRDED